LALTDPTNPFLIPTFVVRYAEGNVLLQQLLAGAQNITMAIPGSGPIQQSDKVALTQMYSTFLAANGNQSLPFNGYGTSYDISGGLQSWDMLLTTPSFDPCVNRAYGIYCIDGRIVWINCNNCGLTGPIPPAIGSLTALREIDLSLGNIISGSLPCEIGNLVVRTASSKLNFFSNNVFTFLFSCVQNLTNFNLASNQVVSLSNCFGPFTKIEILNLAANLLTSLPQSISAMTTLKTIIISGNQISTIPELSALTNLVTLDFSGNKIQSPLWSFSGMKSLRTLDLHQNKFYGTISDGWFDQLPMLVALDVSQNSLFGSLPALRNCTSLTTVNFGMNQVF
jgi:Leucine-rich repeat (LRR) protein